MDESFSILKRIVPSAALSRLFPRLRLAHLSVSSNGSSPLQHNAVIVVEVPHMFFQYPQTDRPLCSNDVHERVRSHERLSVSSNGSSPLQPPPPSRRGGSVLTKLARQGLFLASQSVIFPVNLATIVPDGYPFRKSVFAQKWGGFAKSICQLFRLDRIFRKPIGAVSVLIRTLTYKLSAICEIGSFYAP